MGGGRKDSAVISSRGGGAALRAWPLRRAAPSRRGRSGGLGRTGGGGTGRGARRGSGAFQGSPAGRALREQVGGSKRPLYLVRRQIVELASNWIIVDMLMRRLGCG